MRRIGLVAVALLIALGSAGVARGGDKVVEQEGDVVVAFGGGIAPRALPRTELAPVAVKIDSTFKSSEGADPPPQLQTISIAINRNGKIFDRGLPTCRVRRIQPATIAAARKLCRKAIVGSGRVGVRVHLANQAPFTFKGPLLVFHAKRAGGHRRLIAQVYGLKPPSAFVLNFKIVKEPKELGTVIKTALPKAADKWAYVTHFEMRLRRTYTYNGRRHSFISARCAAPPGFPGAVYQFAKAKFGFASGEQVTPSLIRDCKVAK